MHNYFLLATVCTLIFCCSPDDNSVNKQDLELVILGTAQDAGSPHIGCNKKCCDKLWNDKIINRQVVSLGIIDRLSNKFWLFEATPDMPNQIQQLIKHSGFKEKSLPDGIFLTHAHIGHYTGLIFLGREAIGAKQCKVYAMPKMRSYLKNNGPWSQLVSLNNIKLMNLSADSSIQLSKNISIVPFVVPHRDEFSETVGYQIISKNKSLIFIPDIDKWEKWHRNILDEVKKHDHVLIDATFYQNKEVKGRDMSEIPHPFVEESMAIFKDLPIEEKQKIIFIHFNHSNPLLDPESDESKYVESKGFKLARQLDVIPL